MNQWSPRPKPAPDYAAAVAFPRKQSTVAGRMAHTLGLVAGYLASSRGGYACGRVEEVKEEGEDVGGRRGGRLDLSLVHGAYPSGIVQGLQGIAHREWGRRTKVASSATTGARTPCRSVRKLGLGNFAVISWARFWRHLAW